MAIGYLDSSYLDDIADAIREKTGDSASLSVGDMPDAIASISGGGDVDMAELFYKLFQQGSISSLTVDRTTFSRANCANIRSIRPYSFYQLGMLGQFDAVFPNVTAVYDNAFRGSFVHEVTFEKAVTQVTGYVFASCSSLVRVNAPNGIMYGSSMFDGCSSLAEMPNGYFSGVNTTIPNNCFYNCRGLTAITIPGTVTALGSACFNGCTGITSVTIPSSVTRIDSGAFSNTGLTDLVIPATVTLMTSSPAQNCTALKTMDLRHRGNLPAGCCMNDAALEVIDWTPQANGTNTIYVDGTNSPYGYPPFHKCPALRAWIVRSSTPPTLRGTYLWSDLAYASPGGWPANAYIYVPDDAVETYKAATNWSVFANYIKPLSEYVAS